jgi:hypothetical protein
MFVQHGCPLAPQATQVPPLPHVVPLQSPPPLHVVPVPHCEPLDSPFAQNKDVQHGPFGVPQTRHVPW